MPGTEEVVETANRRNRLEGELFGASLRTRRCFLLALVLALVLAAIGVAARDFMYATAMMCAAVCIALILRLMHAFPRVLNRLLSVGVLTVRRGAAQEVEPSSNGGMDERHAVLKAYTRTLKDRLNWRWQCLAVFIVVSALVCAWRTINAFEMSDPAAFLRASPFKDLAGNGPLSFSFYVVGFGAEVFVVTVVGMLGLRFVTIGMELTRLTARFDIEPLFHHPDRCGGLKPLGSLSQLMAVTLVLPGIVLAVWIVLAEQLERYAGKYDELLPGLLLTLIILAAATFFAPLWRVHQAMVDKAASADLGVAQLGRRIDETTKLLLRGSGDSSTQNEEQLTARLHFLRGLYKDSQRLPVWPFDWGILARSLGPLVPLVSVVWHGTAATVLGEILKLFGE